MRSSLQLLPTDHDGAPSHSASAHLAPSSRSSQTRHSDATTMDAMTMDAMTMDAMTMDLQRLQRACQSRREADWKLESLGCKLAAELAQMVADADLLHQNLPRGYVARINCGEAYLAKCAPDSGATLFLLARRESTFARLEPQARELTHAQILEFMRDIGSGLINEIADFVENCNRSDEAAASCLDLALRACRSARKVNTRKEIVHELGGCESRVREDNTREDSDNEYSKRADRLFGAASTPIAAVPSRPLPARRARRAASSAAQNSAQRVTQNALVAQNCKLPLSA